MDLADGSGCDGHNLRHRDDALKCAQLNYSDPNPGSVARSRAVRNSIRCSRTSFAKGNCAMLRRCVNEILAKNTGATIVFESYRVSFGAF